VLWFRVALRLDAPEAEEWLSLEEDHLALLREDRRFLAHANGQAVSALNSPLTKSGPADSLGP
jgi:hypothetical protein